ncbi:MAG: hypothetical protein WA792_09400 [Pseudolabrys sp.]
MPIDLSAVNWVYVGVLSVFAFVATVIGNILSLNHRGIAAILAAIVFAALFVGWTYYPHHLPLPTRLAPG